jgi:hypothetical protein
MGTATAKNAGRGHSKAPVGVLQPLGEILLQICCRCKDDKSPYPFKVVDDSDTDAVPPYFPERPSAPEIERIVVGFRMIDYPACGHG